MVGFGVALISDISLRVRAETPSGVDWDQY